MAITNLSTANTFINLSSSYSIISPSSSFTSQKHDHNNNNSNNRITTQQVIFPLCCKNARTKPANLSIMPSSLSKRRFALTLSSLFLLPFAQKTRPLAEAAVLEAEDDLELLEKVKKDRKKRIERQGIINSSKQEKGYLQDAVYKLSAVGQAIENNDLNAASSVLGKTTNTDWIKKTNSAFSKLSSSPEEKEEAEVFNSSISKLISSVDDKDMESCKLAFVSSATAIEKWTTLTGISDQLKGL